MDVLVFDLDNTLLDRDRAIDAYLRAWGAEGDSHAALIKIDDRGYADRSRFCNEVVRRLALPLNAHEFWQDMQSNLGSHCAPDPQRIALIERLKTRARVGLLTNGGAVNQRLKITNSGLNDVFDFIVVAGELGAAKPEREAFLACERWAAARYVMIGDHPEHDIAGATACGWKTIWVSNGRTWTGADRPDAQILDVGTVELALERLFE